MPSEQLDFFGRAEQARAPKVPPVIFARRATRERIVTSAKPICGHCMLTAEALGRLREPWPEPYAQFPPGSWIPQRASYRFTQTDGSTLDLCVQHAKAHQARGEQDG
jgi:hypothetical protein